MRQRPSFRPGLERLEHRIELTCFLVTNPLAQQGRGSLPWAAEKAVHRGDHIVFEKGTEVALLLTPVTFRRGVTLSGPPGGVLLEADVAINMRDLHVRGVTIVPFSNGMATLD